MTGASNITTDLVGSNQIKDYSAVLQPFNIDQHKVILRCASGLGALGNMPSTSLGGWYFEKMEFPVGGRDCMKNYAFEVLQANGKKYPGVINLYLCENFSINEEGIYSCIMKNSSMMNQTVRVGLYLNGRSK